MVKSLIAIAICLVLSKARADEAHEAAKTKKIQAECAAEIGIDIKRAEELEDYDKPLHDRRDRCYLKCVYVKWNLIDKEGIINREAIKKEFEEVKNIDAILDRCNEQSMKVKDVCDRVYKLETCIFDQEEAEEEAQYKEVSESCAKEMGINVKILDQLENLEIYKNKKNKCLLKCIYTRMDGWMDEQGNMNVDSWAEYYEDIKNIKPVLKNCLDKYHDETDLCEKAYKFSTCVDQRS